MLLTLIIVVSIVLIININDAKEIVMQDNNKQINNSFLTLMLEQSDGTYLESTSNTWPGEGYIFNSELSSCENGGELDYDSENNKVILYSNQSDGCYVFFDLYNKPVINSINLTETTNNSITISVSATNGTNPISNYYYIINDGTPVSTTSSTYTFSGLNAGATYTIKVYVADTEGYESDISSLSVETDNPILLADWVIDQYNGIQGNNGIYYHTSSLANSAGDNSYRYSGANPNNYVCFGSDAETCPSDNLYRIIGIFNDSGDYQVKLIKADYATVDELGTNGDYYGLYSSSTSNLYSFDNYLGNLSSDKIGAYYWSNVNQMASYNETNYYNHWEYSYLNIINLNKNFYNHFENSWQNKISLKNWFIDGHDWNYRNIIPQEFYDVECSGKIYSAKIGLMYVSDYTFATNYDYWATFLGSYNNLNITNNNWMYMGLNDWTITRRSNSNSDAFQIIYDGVIDGGGDGTTTYNHYAIRPTFYLKPGVTYISGNGSKNSPFRIDCPTCTAD